MKPIVARGLNTLAILMSEKPLLIPIKAWCHTDKQLFTSRKGCQFPRGDRPVAVCSVFKEVQAVSYSCSHGQEWLRAVSMRCWRKYHRKIVFGETPPRQQWRDWTYRKCQVNRNILWLLETRGNLTAQKDCLIPHSLILTTIRRQFLAQSTKLFDEGNCVVSHRDGLSGILVMPERLRNRVVVSLGRWYKTSTLYFSFRGGRIP